MQRAHLACRTDHVRRIATVLVAAIVLVLFANSRVSSDDLTQKVSVVTFNCAHGRDEAPSLDSKVSAQQVATPQELSNGVYRFEIALPPGYYVLSASTPDRDSDVKYGGCYAMASFTVLEGHDRNIVMPLSEGRTIDDADCSIAGSLPTSGLAVGLVRPAGGETPAFVDGSAYYFDNLTPSHYEVRFRFATGTHADYPVDLSDPRAPHGVICSGENAIRHRLDDISMAELARLALHSTYTLGENSAAELTGGQLRALVISYHDVFESQDAVKIPVEHFSANVALAGPNFDVGLFLKRHNGTFTGGGIVEIIDASSYRIKARQSYCPDRKVSATLTPC